MTKTVSGDGGHVLVAPAPLARTTRPAARGGIGRDIARAAAATIARAPAASRVASCGVAARAGVASLAIGTADTGAATAANVAPTASPTVGVSQLLRA